MKVLYINIFEGAEEPERYQKIITYINKVKPDVLGLSELNHWQDNNFKKLNNFKEQTNLKNHVFVEATSGYNLAFFTNKKIIHQKAISKGFKTGLVIAEIDKIQYIITHLHSKNEDLRLEELKIIERERKHMPTILMGDLNSLSSQDSYPDSLLKKLQDLNIHKFGTNNLRTEVISEIESQYIDAVKLFHNDFEYSVPTPFNKDHTHADKLRLDYFFITPDLKDKIKSASIVRNKQTDSLSDHYPIFSEFLDN